MYRTRTRVVSCCAGLSLLLAVLSAHASDLNPLKKSCYFVTSGVVTGLTILVDFADDQSMTNYNAAAMSRLMNEHNFPGFKPSVGSSGSVRDFFLATSMGTYDFTNIVFNFDASHSNGGSNGYFRAPFNKAYYSGPANWSNLNILVTQALESARNQGFIFSNLTRDASNNVPGLLLLYANTNLTISGPAPQDREVAVPPAAPFYTANGVNVRWYADSSICEASFNYPVIGVICHECGHLLAGWTDMDDRTPPTFSYGDGGFCIMSGCLNENYPPRPSAYLRQELGWISVIDIDASTPPQDVVLTSARNTCYRYKNPAHTQECFLVEVRDCSDVSYAGYALAIWHVDETPTNTLFNGYADNVATSHYRCALIQADNKLDLEHSANNGSSDDLYFSPNADRFDDYTTPSAHWWNGSNSCFAIGRISRQSPALRFCINPLVLNAHQTARGTVAAPFSYPLQTRGGVTFTLAADTLPTGLSLVGNTITGTPASAGLTAVTLTADTGGTNTYTYPLTINIASSGLPSIDSSLVVTATSYNAFSYDITASGTDPMTYSYAKGPSNAPFNVLPAGLTFTNGHFYGFPTVVTRTNNITITASNALGSDSKVLNIAVISKTAPSVSNGGSIPVTGQVGTAYNYALTCSSGNPPPVFSVTAGTLPPGLVLSYDGVISGSPTATGTYSGTITVANTMTNIVTQSFSITVGDAVPSNIPTLSEWGLLIMFLLIAAWVARRKLDWPLQSPQS